MLVLLTVAFQLKNRSSYAMNMNIFMLVHEFIKLNLFIWRCISRFFNLLIL